MSNGRILVVEDDSDIANMLRIFFSGEDYDVMLTARGQDAIDKCRKHLPDLIVLDIMLPDIDGYEVCRELRTYTRTSHIPIIFVTQKDERSDRIAGLELGADDYVTKPFDIEELRLRVKNAVTGYRRRNLTDPRTGLPSSRLIEDKLRELMKTEDWTLIQVSIDHITPFNEVYGFVAGDEVLRFTAMLLNELIDEYGTLNDFVGHAASNTFIAITTSQDVGALVAELRRRFDDGIRAHYNFVHLDQGGIEQADGTQAPIMRLAIGTVSNRTHRFSDIREITETAAELSRLDQKSGRMG